MAVFPIPRAPVHNPRSGILDVDSSYKNKLLSVRESLYEQAINEARGNREYAAINNYIDAIEGASWNRDRPKYRSNFVDNMIAKARVDSLAMLSDIRPTIDVATQVETYDKIAKIIGLGIHDQWERYDMDLSLLRVVDHALFGVGFWKLGASISNTGEGKFAKLTAIPNGMDTVMPIQCGETIQDSSAVLYRTFKPVHYFKNRWGKKADGLEREQASSMLGMQSETYNRPARIPEYTWNAMSPAMRRHLGLRPTREPYSDASVFPVVELQEYWIEDWSVNEYGQDITIKDPYLELNEHNYWYVVKPGERMFPRKRLIIFAADRIMYDGPSPYWHGMFPFAKLCLNPIVWGPNGLSKYRTLLPLNKALNEIGAGVLDTVRRAVNQVVITKRGAVPDADWQQFLPSRPGGKLMVNPGADPGSVRYVDPPQLPGYVAQEIQYLLTQFDRHAGMLDPGALAKKKQAPAADAIEQMKSLQSPAFRMESRFIERFLKDAGLIAVSNFLQYFNAPQRLRMMGRDGLTAQDFDYTPKTMVPSSQIQSSFWKMFSIHIAQGSLHGDAHDREKSVAITLQRQGVISSAELLRKLEWGHENQIAKILKEVQEEHQAGLGAGGGRTPRLKTSQKSGR